MWPSSMSSMADRRKPSSHTAELQSFIICFTGCGTEENHCFTDSLVNVDGSDVAVTVDGLFIDGALALGAAAFALALALGAAAFALSFLPIDAVSSGPPAAFALDGLRGFAWPLPLGMRESRKGKLQ